MSIGDLYDANNVIVGQAAVLFAPKDTALPAFSGWNQADPFDPVYALAHTLTTGSVTSLTITYTKEGNAQTTTSLTASGLTAAQIQAALELLSNIGVGNVRVTGGSSPFTILIVGTALGGTLSITPTGGSGSSITNPLWVQCGATDQGWQFSASKSTQTINIEEQSTPVATTVTAQSVSLAGALSEDITATLNLALNATSSTVAPASTVPGYDKVTLTDTVLQYAVMMVTTNPEGFGRIIYAPRWTQLSNAQTAFRRASDKRMYPVQFDTVCATNQIAIYNFTVSHS